MATFDGLADRYDRTRGGERRGHAYASKLAGWLNPEQTVLDVGVGTGVVALGLRQRGFPVVGVDVSQAMLAKARQRVGAVVLRADGVDLPFRPATFDQAIAVWVLHAVRRPEELLSEIRRVLRPGARLAVCPSNRAAPDDPVGLAIDEMSARIDRLNDQPTRTATAEQILSWGLQAGFLGQVDLLTPQAWASTTEREINDIVGRTWSALIPLSDEQFHEVTSGALAVLSALPSGAIVRRAIADVVILDVPT